jgi:hypothetical protein
MPTTNSSTDKCYPQLTYLFVSYRKHPIYCTFPHLNTLLSVSHDISRRNIGEEKEMSRKIVYTANSRRLRGHKLDGLDFKPAKHKPSRHCLPQAVVVVPLAPRSSAPMRATPPSYHRRAVSFHTQRARHADQSACQLTR